MSKTLKHETDIEKKQPDYIEDLTAAHMGNMHRTEAPEENETVEAEKQQEPEEDWTEKTSPISGRIYGTMEELERIQSCEMMYSDEVRECLKDSMDCYQNCTETAMRCLKMGGMHAEPKHINLLLDCAKISSTNADFIVRNSTYYPQTCGICADICDECADDCERYEDDFMKECASVCRRCAESCREIAR